MCCKPVYIPAAGVTGGGGAVVVSCVVSGGGVVSVLMGVAVVGGVSVTGGGGGSSTGPDNEHAVVSDTASICWTNKTVGELNGDCGPERGREGSVNTTVRESPGLVGRESDPCFPVRSPIEHAKGALGEHIDGSLCVFGGGGGNHKIKANHGFYNRHTERTQYQHRVIECTDILFTLQC